MDRQVALLEAWIVGHAFANPSQIIIPVYSEEFVAVEMIEQKSMHAHLIEFSHRARGQRDALIVAQSKFLEHRLRFLADSFAKGWITVGEIKKFVDLIDAHDRPRFMLFVLP